MAKTNIPTTIEEAFSLLDAKLTAEEKNQLLQVDDSVDFHFGLGLWIRNNWLYPESGANFPFSFDEDQLFMDPDDFSDELIQRYILHLKEKMHIMIDSNYVPAKVIFTDADMDDLCFHDCSIHAIAPIEDGLALDIDYMFEWYSPKDRNGGYSYAYEKKKQSSGFSFQIAPCTLFFKNVSDLGMNFDGFPSSDALIIQDLLEELDKAKYNPERRMFYVNCLGGEFSIFCKGFELVVRQKPVHHPYQVLTLEQRGGISFCRKPY